MEDFDVLDSILRVSEAQEPGNDGLSSKYCLYIKKSWKKYPKTYVGPGSVLSRFRRFPGDPGAVRRLGLGNRSRRIGRVVSSGR